MQFPRASVCRCVRVLLHFPELCNNKFAFIKRIFDNFDVQRTKLTIEFVLEYSLDPLDGEFLMGKFKLHYIR